MAVKLGPGGRGLLVLGGIALLVAGAARAGWLPGDLSWTLRQPEVQAPARAVHLWHQAEAPCEAPPRIAVPPRAAALRLAGGVRVVPVPHGAAALAFLARGEVDGAVASVAEIAGAWPLAEGARIDRVLGGGRDLVVVAATKMEAAALGDRAVAAPAGSAEAFLARAATGAAVQEVEGARQALGQLGAGRAAAAALPRWQLGPAGPVGSPLPVATRVPIDPVVLVTAAGAACSPVDENEAALRALLAEHFGELPASDAPPAAAELVMAWAAARQGRAALPPLELVVAPALAARIWGGPPAPPAVEVIRPASHVGGGEEPAALPAEAR
ncbi:hypothetical protein [Vulgatibacter sp.]|uniref:hypothetical protein n=1 Tax=Vulgatibacter sp. TaxID=1971226 RepID=UPI0035664A3B